MSFTITTLLFLAGIVGGIINALAGGATLVTFPVMLAAGLPPVMANASNSVAVAPGHILAALADREKLPPLDRHIILSLATCVVGGVIGAFVLLVLPDHIFVLPVPALIGFATWLFAFSPRIGAWSERRRTGAHTAGAKRLAALLASSIYGGFFGAGLGIILTAALAVSEPNDIRKVKVLKNLLATCVTLAANLIFIARGAVHWPPTLVMLSGALIGGYAGGHLVRVLPAQIVRWFVIVAGGLMTVVYAQRYWL